MKKSALLLLMLISSFGFAQQFTEAFQSQVKKAQQAHQIPAISVNLITPDSIFSFINGKVRTAKKARIPQDAKFHLGSNSKAITAFIAKHLSEQGIINWDTRFFQLFPELENSSNPAYLDITLGQLLSHNAGINAYTKGADLEKFNTLKGSTSEKRYAFTQEILKEKPADPGTYSNAGYVIAALMLEKATEKPFKTLLDETMNALDLDYFVGFPNKENDTNPWGHINSKGTLTALGPDHEYKLPAYMSSAGDIAMNSQDYARFLQLHLQGLLGKDNFLEAEAYQELHFGLDNYAYGWGNISKNGHQISYHDGSAGTYYCHVVVFPHKEIAVAIMANTATKDAVNAIYTLQKSISDNPENVTE